MVPGAHYLDDLLTVLTPRHTLGSVRTEPGESTPGRRASALVHLPAVENAQVLSLHSLIWANDASKEVLSAHK